MGIWVRGCGCEYGCVGVWCMSVRVWIYECMDICVYGGVLGGWVYVVFWVYGCVGVPVHACVSGWLWGYMGVS